ncbi:Guanine nucleotide-binding protein alpha-2 subunit, partial [Globomyces sp. JEL0801]
MLQVRQVTQSVSETIFEIDKLRLHIYDVSGLRMHRSHWLKYFDEVMTVIFLVALSSYDQVLLEDPTVNRMADAIVLFDQIANHPLLQKLELMLFFNKKDIFEKKVAKSSINQYFPEYQGSSVKTLIYCRQAWKHISRF